MLKPVPATQPQPPVINTAAALDVVGRYLQRDEFYVVARTSELASTAGALGLFGVGLAPMTPVGFVEAGLCALRGEVKEGLSLLTSVAGATALAFLAPGLLGASACLWGVSATALVPSLVVAAYNDDVQSCGGRGNASQSGR